MNEIFYEVFDTMPRLGPGSAEATKKAFKATGLGSKRIEILDIGCGTGAQTLVLAKMINGKIIATDNYQPFLDTLADQASTENLSDKIICKNMDMAKLEFEENQFDLIWAEGSIYHIGFANGLRKIKSFLKPNGYAAFSDLNWFKRNHPKELAAFFANECPDMVSVEENIKLIADNGYKLIDFFRLDESVFWEPYYTPLEKRLSTMRKKYADNEEALAMFAELQLEIDLYRKYSDYYGYAFYIMKNIS
ncbi:MAG: methyltransferase domain-containing protein [Calditrichaceae bacterium]|nr:methyltransferase domain-containing protein [Calditrichaceae bacterium]